MFLGEGLPDPKEETEKRYPFSTMGNINPL